MNRKEFAASVIEEINKSLKAEGLDPLDPVDDAVLTVVVDVMATTVFAVAHMVENLAVATKSLDALTPRGTN